MGKYIYNLKKDVEDLRDHHITKTLAPVVGVKLPSSVDLRSKMPPVFDQGELGSCFHPDTKIVLWNGIIKTLKELYESNDSFIVHSIDKYNKRVPGRAICNLTGLNKKVIKIIFNNDREEICTPDHEFMLIDGTYKQAQELTINDILMPIYQIENKIDQVIGIIDLNEISNVYCLTVEKYNNFALEAGVFVHNCSANAGVGNLMYLKNPNLMLSRLFLYYEERSLEGTINEDSGAQMRDICKALNKIGTCEEQYFPYDITKFTNPPTPDAITNATNHKILAYHSLKTIDDIKNNLALRQRPVLMGMSVYESFESEAVAKTGKVPIPNPAKEQNLGGHAVVICGFINAPVLQKLISPITGKSAGCFIVRNSWGLNWGDKGYFYLPYEYITKGFAFDFWSLDS